MDYHELPKFRENIQLAETFFTELAARESEIMTLGMRTVSKWESYKAASGFLKEFENQVHEFEQFLRAIDKNLFNRATTMIDDASLVEAITSIEVSLRIAANKRQLNSMTELSNNFLLHFPYISKFFGKRKMFSDEDVPLRKVIVALGRLQNLIVMTEKSYMKKWSHDSDVFKPSNLDENRIIELIEAAIESVENLSPLSADDKKELVSYLYKAKSEFSEKKPSWNKIVGALVIAAAITSGVADSSGAMENIDKAIEYILGSSVEKHIPKYKRLPLLQAMKKPDLEDDLDTISDV